MDKYKYETKYNINDNVFVIKHTIPNPMVYGMNVECYNIYNTKITGINIDMFGITYSVDKITCDFKEEDIFLKTDKKGLFDRLSKIMEEDKESD